MAIQLTTDLVEALEELHRIGEGWNNGLIDFFEGMSCSEVEAIADVFRAIGDTKTAISVIDAHAEGDQEDDEHWDIRLAAHEAEAWR